MAPISPATTKLELVQDAKGRLRLMHEGAPVPGVVHIDISQNCGQRPVIVVQIHALAVRFSALPIVAAADVEA